MGKKWLFGSALGTLAAAGAGAAVGYTLLRRAGLRWGATDAEVGKALPGDGAIADAEIVTTHAVTVDAPPAAIWPWLVQQGYGRAQWYTDAPWDPFLETVVYPAMVPADKLPPGGKAPRSATAIRPELQHLAVGDVVPDGPPGTAWFTVVEIQPQRAIVYYSDTHADFLCPVFLQGTRWETHGAFTWAFVLEPVTAQSTRLLLRARCTLTPRAMQRLILPAFYLAEALTPRRMLCGIKARVEKAKEHQYAEERG